MIWVLFLRPRFYRALVRDIVNALRVRAASPLCRVTHDPVPADHRTLHEATQHPTDGPCVLL